MQHEKRIPVVMMGPEAEMDTPPIPGGENGVVYLSDDTHRTWHWRPGNTHWMLHGARLITYATASLFPLTDNYPGEFSLALDTGRLSYWDGSVWRQLRY